MKLEELRPQSESLGALSLALAKAHAKIQQPKKTIQVNMELKNGRKINYKYSDLNDVIESYRSALCEMELVILQRIVSIQEPSTPILSYATEKPPVQRDHSEYLITTLSHSSGEFIQTWVKLHNRASGVQEFGSEITYLRRYSISCLLGIASDGDDDGASADGDKDLKTQSQKNDPGKSPSGAPPVVKDEGQKIMEVLESKIKYAVKGKYALDELDAIEKEFRSKEPSFTKLGIFEKGIERIKTARNILEGQPA